MRVLWGGACYRLVGQPPLWVPSRPSWRTAAEVTGIPPRAVQAVMSGWRAATPAELAALAEWRVEV